ncbi:hypothetical protein HPB50_026654 [Hyalomma asiaticum]|uniref:Uncharacterized protein n=1 Tax=Hyalomma asiaticum TaxID=266040 RepID=A0ACB7RU74_HYAAI|nr:hypothetical protein HPB50_026654 [Hyalomma asiaticum]
MDLLFPKRLAGVDLRTSESFDCEECFGYGPFQKRMLIVIMLGLFSAHCQTLTVSLVTGDVDHWCKPPGGFNISAGDWKAIAIPMEADGTFSRCRVYERCKSPAEDGPFVDHQNRGAVPHDAGSWYNRCFINEPLFEDFNDTRNEACAEWDYDVRKAEISAVSTWNMVCDRRLMRVALFALQSSGSVVGLVLVGAFADLRRPEDHTRGFSCRSGYLHDIHVCGDGIRELRGGSFPGRGQRGRKHDFCHADPFRDNDARAQATASAPPGSARAGLVRVIDWRLKQVIFLAPTALLVPALLTTRESPRWLVAVGRLDEAEAVMMQAAKINNFPLPGTACLVQKIREQVKNPGVCEGADGGDLLDCRSLRRRALSMFAVCFSISFVFYVDAVSVLQYKEHWMPCFTVVVTLSAYVAMHYLITGVALVTVLSACFLLTGCIQCALSIATAAAFGMVTKTLVVLSKGVSNVLVVHCFTYILELFPSAIRAGIACWSFRLRPRCSRYEDVVFAVAGLFLFASLFVIRALPRTTVVEEARIVAKHASDTTKMSVDHMKRTLDVRAQRKRSAAPSADSSKASSRRSQKSTGSSSSGSSTASRRSRAEQARVSLNTPES